MLKALLKALLKGRHLAWRGRAACVGNRVGWDTLWKWVASCSRVVSMKRDHAKHHQKHARVAITTRARQAQCRHMGRRDCLSTCFTLVRMYAVAMQPRKRDGFSFLFFFFFPLLIDSHSKGGRGRAS
jgi:hypothetical protein